MNDYGFIHRYPETNFHELNLDWILAQMVELRSDMRNFVNQNTIKYADPIQWNITTQYEGNTVVIEPNSGNAYLSSQPVPAGVTINNTDYWSVIGNFSEFFTSIKDSITPLDEGSSTVASANRFPGDWVWLNNVLYQVTDDIVTGQTYVDGVNCETITLHDAMDDLISKNKVYFDTVADMIANISPEDVHYAQTAGYITKGDGGASLYNIRLITGADTVASVGDPINQYGLINIDGTYCAELIPNAVLDMVQFGVMGSGDSAKVQACFNYAASKGISDIISSSDIQISEISITSDVCIDMMMHTIQGVRFSNTANIVKNMMTANNVRNITIKNAIVNGYRDIATPSGSRMPYVPLFDFSNGDYISFEHIICDNIDQNYIGSSDFSKIGCYFSTTDCKFTSISDCKFLYAKGEELNGIWAYNQNRRYVNASFKNNYFGTDVYTSVLDFNGNYLDVKNNIYNFDYPGSVMNCFGLNVNIEGDSCNGTVNNVYDNCEEVCYTGDTFKCNNVRIAATNSHAFQLAALDICLDNIIINSSVFRMLTLRPGYSSPNTMPHGTTSASNQMIVSIRNCIINSGAKWLYDGTKSGQYLTQVSFIGCSLIGSESPISAKGVDLIFDGCNFYGANNNGSYMICRFPSGQNQPDSIRMNNCKYINHDSTIAEAMFEIHNTDAMLTFTGNMTTARNNQDLYISAGSACKTPGTAGNVGYAS